MSEEIQEPIQPVKKVSYVWIFVTIFIASLCEDILFKLVAMPRPLAILTADSLVFLVAYRFLPKPKRSFISYAIFLETVFIGWVLARYVAAPYLETFLPFILAHGLALILWGILLYFTFRSLKSYNNTLKNS